MSEITYDIVGKNSRLYKSLRPLLNNVRNEYSYSEVDRANLVNPIVFSFSKSSYESNQRFLETVMKRSKGRVIYISTTAIFSNVTRNAYKYARIKKEIENYLLPLENVTIIRAGMVEGFFNFDNFIGYIKYSSLKMLVNSMSSVFAESRPNGIIDAWVIKRGNSARVLSRKVHSLLCLLSRVLKSRFYLTRPFDVLLKFIGEKNYGYTFLSNRFDPHTKYLVVGSGMSAYGVLEALKEKDELCNVRVIHARSSERKYYESSKSRKSIESLGNGGNSSLWHSVISSFRGDENIRSMSEYFFEKLYPKSSKISKELDYSFIPVFPIRPLKRLTKNKNALGGLVDDTIIRLEKSGEGKILLHGARGTYTTDNLFLCTGAISSIKLLTDSQLIKTNESSLSEHLVGYFGQFSGKLKNPQVIRSVEGHFKKFHEIELESRKLCVTFRPANFQFKNLTEANNYRNFFGKSSYSIFWSLFKKANLGLLLEAFYNKFGVEFNLHNMYNIAGHIESKNTVSLRCSPFSNPEVSYTEKEIIFSDWEIAKIKDYLSGLGIESHIQINHRTQVSPGLHFLNSSLKNEISKLPEGIKLFSSILFEDESPRHPTYDLFIDSYSQTLTLLNSVKNV